MEEKRIEPGQINRSFLRQLCDENSDQPSSPNIPKAQRKSAMLSREERFKLHRQKSENIITYLSTSKYPEGTTKNQQRVIRFQAKNHVWDENTKELYFIGGRTTARKKVVMYVEEAGDILREFHSSPSGGHAGINATLSKVSLHYFWQCMKDDIKEYVEACDRCQLRDRIKNKPPDLIQIEVQEPLELVGMDLTGPLTTTAAGNKYVCTFVDVYTKFVDIYPMEDKSVEDVSQCVKAFVCKWGAPARLLSNQTNEFVAMVRERVCAQLAINCFVISARNPESSGLNKRVNQIIKARVAKLASEQEDSWDLYLEELSYSIRTSQVSGSKYSPFFLMFGRHPRGIQQESVDSDPGEIKDTLMEEMEQTVNATSILLSNMQEQVQSNLGLEKTNRKEMAAWKKAMKVRRFSFRAGGVQRKKVKTVHTQEIKIEREWIDSL